MGLWSQLENRYGEEDHNNMVFGIMDGVGEGLFTLVGGGRP